MAGKKQHFWIDRRYARISSGLSCTVATSHGKSHQAQMLNLSAGGLKFSCPHESFIELLPDTQRTPGLIQDVVIEVQFELSLPDETDTRMIRTPANVIHTERLAQDCYHIGAQFKPLTESDAQALEAYIAKAVNP